MSIFFYYLCQANIIIFKVDILIFVLINLQIMELSLIQNKIYEIRGTRVMIDTDLALMYQVETRVLNQAVKRNIDRFPEPDFMFQLTLQEWENMSSQFVMTYPNKRPKTALPLAFTELGVSIVK